MLLNSKNLYETIMEYKGESLFLEVVLPWIKESDYKFFLSSINTNQTLSEEESWELYALSRVLDIMTLHFQTDKNADGSSWPGPKLSLNEYIEFNNLIGLETLNPKTYHPFHCEMMEVQSGDNDFEISKIDFPSSRLKNMLIKRSGVRIVLNPELHNLSLINSSTIYWAFRRKNRRYKDLSQGWGSNSQWRTLFRMDIETTDSYIYNQGGKIDLNFDTNEVQEILADQNLRKVDAIELTRNRYFISSAVDDSDLFPYDFKYSELKEFDNL